MPAVSGADTGWRPSKKATSWILVENWCRDLVQYPNIIQKKITRGGSRKSYFLFSKNRFYEKNNEKTTKIFVVFSLFFRCFFVVFSLFFRCFFVVFFVVFFDIGGFSAEKTFLVSSASMNFPTTCIRMLIHYSVPGFNSLWEKKHPNPQILRKNNEKTMKISAFRQTFF